MHSVGLRTSESAAVNQNDMVISEDFVVVIVNYQEQNGKRVTGLKKESSHRRVVLDEWGSDVIRKANTLIGVEPDTDSAPITSRELSEWVKTTLNKLGCGDEYWNSAIKDMGNNPEYDRSGAPSTDVAAYILRRDAESRWANICGLSKEEQDIQLGHKRYTKGKKRLNLTDPNVYRTIAMKLKRYNPYESPRIIVNLYHGEDETLIPFGEYDLVNTSCENLKVTIVMKNAEPGDSIIMKTNGEILESRVNINKEKPLRENTECIGRCLYQEMKGEQDEEQ